MQFRPASCLCLCLCLRNARKTACHITVLHPQMFSVRRWRFCLFVFPPLHSAGKCKTLAGHRRPERLKTENLKTFHGSLQTPRLQGNITPEAIPSVRSEPEPTHVWEANLASGIPGCLLGSRAPSWGIPGRIPFGQLGGPAAPHMDHPQGLVILGFSQEECRTPGHPGTVQKS